MQYIKHFLVAAVTALLHLTLCVEPEPTYNNAPVALLLPNGTIVMIPGRNPNNAKKTSNEQYENYQSKNCGSKHESKLQKSVGLPLWHNRNRQQLIGVHPTSVNSCCNSALGSAKDWIKKDVTCLQNINDNPILTLTSRQLRNVQMCEPRKAMGSNMVNNQGFCSAESRGGCVEVSNPLNSTENILRYESSPEDHEILDKREFSSSRSQIQNDISSEQLYDMERSNRRPYEISNAAAKQQQSRGSCSSLNLKKRISNYSARSSTPCKYCSRENSDFEDTVRLNTKRFQRKDNMAGFRLNLLEGRENLMGDVLLRNENTRNPPQEKRRSNIPKKKTFFIHERLDYGRLSQNESSSGGYSRIESHSNLKNPSYLSWSQLKTPARSKGFQKGNRAKLSEFAKCTEKADQNANRNIVDRSKIRCRRPMGTRYTKGLKEHDAYLSTFGEHQRVLSPICIPPTRELNLKICASNNDAQKRGDQLERAVAGNNYSSELTRKGQTLKDSRSATFSKQCREKCTDVEIPRGNGENMSRELFESGVGKYYDNLVCLKEYLWKNNKQDMEETHGPYIHNGNGVRFNREHPLKNMQLIMSQPRIIECPRQQEITSYPPAVVPNFLHARNVESVASQGSFWSQTMLLNKYPGFQDLGSPKVFRLPSLFSPTVSTGSATHCTRSPWMCLPILPPMNGGDRWYSDFSSSFLLPPHTTSIATFVKDGNDQWMLIHYEIIL